MLSCSPCRAPIKECSLGKWVLIHSQVSEMLMLPSRSRSDKWCWSSSFSVVTLDPLFLFYGLDHSSLFLCVPELETQREAPCISHQEAMIHIFGHRQMSLRILQCHPQLQPLHRHLSRIPHFKLLQHRPPRQMSCRNQKHQRLSHSLFYHLSPFCYVSRP